jgi:hypothetical protein
MSAADDARMDDLDLAASSSGAELLSDVYAALTRYVVLPSPEAADAVTLWIAATHCLPAFEHATRLSIRSPVKRCGKSRLMELLGALAYNPLSTTNISVPALFRIIDAAGEKPPTLLLDEADRLFGSARRDEDNRDLIALLNNGFRAGSPTWRCVGPAQVPTPFSNYAMAAVAGIGHQPDTIEDRAVCITMRRRAPTEHVAKLRLRTDLGALRELQTRLSAWAEQHSAELARIPGEMPDLEDRAHDAWEPLVAVADAAGGDWPERARRAALALSGAAKDEDADRSPSLRLLADIREIFTEMTVSFLPSNELVNRLRRIDDAPWRDEDLTTLKLSKQLREYGIRPGRNTAGTTRGYRKDDFADAFARYLSADPSEPVRPVSLPSDLGELSDGFGVSDGSTRQTESTRQALTWESDGLTGSDGSPDGNGNREPVPTVPITRSNGFGGGIGRDRHAVRSELAGAR